MVLGTYLDSDAIVSLSGSNLLLNDKLVSLDAQALTGAHLSTPLTVAGECCITLSSVMAQLEIVAAEGIAHALLSPRFAPAVTFNSPILFADHVVAVAPSPVLRLEDLYHNDSKVSYQSEPVSHWQSPMEGKNSRNRSGLALIRLIPPQEAKVRNRLISPILVSGTPSFPSQIKSSPMSRFQILLFVGL